MKQIFLVTLIFAIVGCAKEVPTPPSPGQPPAHTESSPVSEYVQVLEGPAAALEEILALVKSDTTVSGRLNDGRRCDIRVAVKRDGAAVVGTQVNLKVHNDLVEGVSYELNFDVLVDEHLGNKVHVIKSRGVTSVNQSWMGAITDPPQPEATDVLTLTHLDGRLTEVTVYQTAMIESSFATATCILGERIN